jgi:hypothetical protein
LGVSLSLGKFKSAVVWKVMRGFKVARELGLLKKLMEKHSQEYSQFSLLFLFTFLA